MHVIYHVHNAWNVAHEVTEPSMNTVSVLTSKFAQMRCITSTLIASDIIGSMTVGTAQFAAASAVSLFPSDPRVTAKMGMTDESPGELDP